MGTIPRVSELSGRKYEFTVAGDEPTVDELRRIDAIIRADDSEFAKSFEETYGESATPGEGAGITNLAGEFFKGIGRGGLGLLETGALGAATLLPEEYEDPTREFIRRQGYAATQGLQPDLGLEDTRTGKFGEALGSIAGTYAPLALGPLGVPIAAGLATGAGAGEASERARAVGTDEAIRSDAALKGAGVGLTELIPFIGPLQKALRPFGVRNRILRAFEQGGIEGAQEAAANTLQNLIQQGYDPTQLLTEGNLEAAGYGAGAGGLIQLMVDLVIPNRRVGEATTIDGADTTLTEEERRKIKEAAAKVNDAKVDEERRKIKEAATKVVAPKEVAEAVTPEQQQVIDKQAEQLAEDLIPKIVGGLDGNQADGDGAAGDGQGVREPQPRSIFRSPTGTGASQQQRVGESSQTPDLPRVRDGAQSDTLEVVQPEEVIEEFENQALKEEEVLAEDVVPPEIDGVPSEADAFEMAAARADQIRKAKEPEDAAFREAAEFEAEQREAARLQAELEAGTQEQTAQQQLEEVEQKAKGETPPNLKIPLVPQARVRGTPTANRQFIPEGIEPVPYEPKQEAELEPSAISTAPEPVAALPTMQVLLELGVSQGSGPFQIAKNSLAKSIEDNDREAILADRDDILAALKKYKPKKNGKPDEELRARIAEYVAKAMPKEDSIDADIKARDAAQRRQRKAQLQQQKDNEAAAVRREEAKAIKAAADSAVSLPDTSAAQPVSEADAQAKRIADAEKASKGDPNRPSVILGNKSTSANVDQITDQMLFEEFVRNNTFIRDPETNKKVRPRTSQALSPTQLTNAAQEFAKIQAAKKTVAREQRTDDEVVAAAFKKQDRIEAARVKAFEGWLKTREQDAETLSDAELLALRKEFDDDVLVSDENGLSEFMPIPIEYVVGLDYPLDATTLTMLEDNNLGDALRQYARTTPNKRFAPMAKALARVAGNTRVVFADVGDRIAGAFDPETNTIVFNTNVPLTGHTLLHEMLHAATSATIANNPGAASVKAIERIYNEVRESLPSYYGSSSLLEFVAEAFSNPKFQQQLAQFRVKGKGESAFSQFKRAVSRMARSIFNVHIKNNAIQYREPISALDELELQIGSLLAPAPQYRNAEVLFNIANNPKQANKAMNSALRNGPIFNDEGATKYLAFMEDKTRSGLSVLGETLGSILTKATPLHYMDDVALRYFPTPMMQTIIPQINNTMNKAAGALQEAMAKTKVITDGLAKWANTHKDLAPSLNRLFNESTLYEVDPELNELQAIEAYGEGTERLARWQGVRDLVVEVNKGGADGMRQYRLARNLFRAKKDELRRALGARLDDAGVDAATRDEVLNSFFQRLAEQGSIDPYFPLNRRGDFWIQFEAVDPNTGRIEYYAEAYESDAQRARAYKKLMPELIQNYVNSEGGQAKISATKGMAGFPDTLTDSQIAERLIAESMVFPRGVDIQHYTRRAPDTAFVNQLMSKVNEQAAGNETLRAEVTELILNTLPQTSYLQSFRQRKAGEIAQGALGYNPDAITTITDRANSITRQVVEMEYKGKFSRLRAGLEQAFNAEVKNTATPGQVVVYEQLQKFNEIGAFPQVSGLSRVATGVAFNFTLGFNVSGGLVNLSQIPLIALPYLGGKYKSYPATMRAMRKAGGLIRTAGRTRKVETFGTDDNGNPTTEVQEVPAAFSAENIDFDRTDLSQDQKDLKELVEAGVDTGQFRRSLDHEILDIDRMNGFWAKFNKASGFFLFHGERMNREVSMIAAYQLALEKARKANPNVKRDSDEDIQLRKDAAIEAINDAEMMNGGLAAGAAPTISQNALGRVVFMYKRYGVSMLSLLHSLYKDATTGQSREARRIAAYQLAGIYGSAGVLAGVAGMPLYGMASLVFDTFADDEDDPMDDADTIVRTYLGEGPYRGALNYVTGINFASRVGLGELLFRDTFINSSAPLLYQALEYGGGPIVGILAQGERGFKLFGEGEFYRGFEAMSPAALKNALKMVRYSTEGVETVGGDKIIEDLHPAHLGLQFLGFAPAEYSRQLEENAVLKGADRATSRRKKKLLDMYFRNYFDGADNSSVLRKIAKYNQEHPNDPITAETIRRSRKTRISGKQSRYHGVTFSPKRRDEYMLYAQQFDKNSSLFM